MSLGGLLINRCAIERWATREPGSDFTFDGTGSYQVVATGVKCAIQERSVKQNRHIGGQSVEFNAVGYFKPGLDLRPSSSDPAHGDRIRVTGGGLYYVRGVTDQVGHAKLLTVYLERTDNA